MAPRKKTHPWGHVARLSSQLVISIFVIGFSMAMLINHRGDLDSNEKALYVSLISTITGVWLPQPQ